MAAIDKMYLKDYYVFDKFRLWCIAHKPTLLYHSYNWNMNKKEWNEWKEYVYNEQKQIYYSDHSRFKSIRTLRAYYKKLYEGINVPNFSDEQLQLDIDYHNKHWEELQDKETWIENYKLPITTFSCEEDKYLLWHCPIKEVREYLINQCGYKDKWYYKLFFKE